MEPALADGAVMGNEKRAACDADIAAWLVAYQRDAPLYRQMPIALNNGKSVPGVHVVCNNCGSSLSGDRVRGRVVQSLLPHVVTIEANGYCQPCDRLTHIDCRVRANAGETLIEWLGCNGLWQAREYRRPTLAEQVSKHVRRLLSR